MGRELRYQLRKEWMRVEEEEVKKGKKAGEWKEIRKTRNMGTLGQNLKVG